jgi:hypothetical protein
VAPSTGIYCNGNGNRNRNRNGRCAGNGNGRCAEMANATEPIAMLTGLA